MPIIFDGEPPYEALYAKSCQSNPLLDGVELILQIIVDEPPGDTVPVRILLEPEVAAALCPGLQTNAGVVTRWRRNR
jgi:hypothetical protein